MSAVAAASPQDLAPPTEARADEDAAYLADRLSRERLASIALALLGGFFVELWGIFDWYLEPAWFGAFQALRLFNTAADVVLLVAIIRTKDLLNLRIYGMILIGLVALEIAIMLPRVHSYGLYALGFSLTFLAPGVILLWPVWAAVGTYAFHITCLVVAHLLYEGPNSTTDMLAVAGYVLADSIICVVLAALRRSMERRAFQLGFRLESKNEELARTLASLKSAQARMVATEKLAATGRLLAGLSHELNNPMNVMKNNLAPLADYAASVRGYMRPKENGPGAVLAAADEARALIQKAQANAETFLRMHSDLRMFVRNDAQGRVVPASPSDGLRATVALMRRFAPPAVTLDLECGDLPPVLHNPGQLNQVFFTVLQNALDAIGPSGRVGVRARTLDNSVVIDVSDSGRGIPTEHLGRLFEPFFTTKPEGTATGLGLATSKATVRALGGDLEVRPHGELGGATFSIRLPLREAAA